jgi:hypothetical protein
MWNVPVSINKFGSQDLCDEAPPGIVPVIAAIVKGQ